MTTAQQALAGLFAVTVQVAAFFVFVDWLLRREATDDDTREHLAWLDVMAELPDTDVFDPPVDLARARLVSVPLQPNLSIVPPVADDSWLEELITARPNPFTVPVQRRPGSAS